MAEPIRIWLQTSHHAAFAVGGWAFVRAEGGVVTGLAGGERRATAERMALAGLAAALKSPPAGPVEVRTACPLVRAIPARIAAAAAGEDVPDDNLDLWAQVMSQLKTGTVRILRVTDAPRTPTAFAAGWALYARDKAKDTGPFSAAIPKANLAKAGV